MRAITLDQQIDKLPATTIDNPEHITVEIVADKELEIVETIKVYPGETPPDPEVEEELLKEDEKQNSFNKLAEFWCMSCIGFFDAFPLFNGVAKYVHHEKSSSDLRDFLQKESIKSLTTEGKDGSTTTKYVLHKQNADEVTRKIKRKQQFGRAEDALAKAQVLAAVAEYEAFIGDLLRLIIQEHPDAFISKDTTISASDIIKGSDLDEIRKSIIEDKIISLQRESHVEQIRVIYNRLKLTPPDQDTLKEFGEICLRRNALTHANGYANRVYIKEMKELGFDEKDIPADGEKFVIDDKYIRRSIARIFQMGYFTLHIVWQHLKKEEHEHSIHRLINHSHEYLSSNYTKVAGRICQFALNKKSPATELDRAYLIINLALSYFLNKDLTEEEREKEVEKVLLMRDWSIVDSKFELALCCLRKDYDKFGCLFDATKDKDFDADDFMSLALFKEARKEEIFKKKMLEHYGIKISSSEDELANNANSEIDENGTTIEHQAT